jgi:hypothetical protein
VAWLAIAGLYGIGNDSAFVSNETFHEAQSAEGEAIDFYMATTTIIFR